jgi:acid phosphatase (class A)
MKKLALAAFAITLLVPLTAAAEDWTKWNSDNFELAKPPAKNSAEHRREAEKMLEFQNGDRREACALGRSQPYANYELLFARSKVLTQAEAAKAKPLITKVFNLTQKITRKFKEHYDRKRPYAESPQIKPCVREVGEGTSYPSSHASMGWAGACVLAKIFPRKAQVLEEYGRHLGDIRSIIGVHWPSDVVAGQELGAVICQSLMNDVDFKRELRALTN